MSDKIFVNGLRFERPRDGSPEFVKGRIGINVPTLTKWLEEHGKDQEWLNADLLQSKDGSKLYFQLNNWKPKAPTEPSLTDRVNQIYDEVSKDAPNPDDIKF